MTERLYYHDSYLREFSARVVERTEDGTRVYLDRTAFYPASGGQPSDTGSLGGARVRDVVDEGERIAHILDAPLDASAVACAVDWDRRFDHMQQHSGQHLLSAVFVELFGIETVSFHLGQEVSTIDLGTESLEPRRVAAAERRANELVCANLRVSVAFEDAATAAGLRKSSERSGTLRIVSIADMDRSACGGTHVRSTGEIGAVLARRLERIRNTVRLEFLCGMRAARRARADYDALSRVAELFSCGLDDAGGAVAAHLESARAADKARRKLQAELDVFRGRALYDAATPDQQGIRRAENVLAAGSLEEVRGIAQSFTAQPRAVYLGAVSNPPSVLLAVSEDAGIDAGKVLQVLLKQAGGRGGGNARMAQGSVPGEEALREVMRQLAAARG